MQTVQLNSFPLTALYSYPSQFKFLPSSLYFIFHILLKLQRLSHKSWFQPTLQLRPIMWCLYYFFAQDTRLSFTLCQNKSKYQKAIKLCKSKTHFRGLCVKVSIWHILVVPCMVQSKMTKSSLSTSTRAINS